MTGTEVLIRAIAQLREAGIDDPARDARRLLAHVLNISPGRLTLVLPDPIAAAEVSAFESLITRRLAREPVSHLIGRRVFYGRAFKVTPSVLDPRPETETLIKHALAVEAGTILDLGTGSGCILLTLLAEQPGARGWVTDISASALTVARDNAEALGVQDRVIWGQGAWFEAVPPDAQFDLIVSNPPYIALDEMAALAPELQYEPRLALTDEADGLTAYRAIISGAPDHLVAGGRLMLEIGLTQADEVSALFLAAGFTDITVLTDLDGRDRVVSGVILPHTDS